MSAYEEGKKAFAAGAWRFENPYDIRTLAHDLWDRGWLESYDVFRYEW